jgi:hypothetical protein
VIRPAHDDGWIPLRRATIKRASGLAGLSCTSYGAVFIVGVFLVASQGFGLLGFFVLTGTLILLVFGTTTIWDLLRGAGVVVAVSRQPARAAESFRARWTIAHPERVEAVRVSWQGHEVSILRGYNDTTFSEPFITKELDAASGGASIDVPLGAMPTFAGKNFRIAWSISVGTRRGEGWTEEIFPVLMAPAR